MISLLRNLTPLIISVLLGITVYSGMQARHYASKLADAQVEISRIDQRAETLLEHQRWQRRRIEAMEAALNEREEQLQRDDQLLQLVRSAARKLEQEDAETADWAGKPIPVAVGDWVRQLPAEYGDSAGDHARANDTSPSAIPSGSTTQGSSE
uniref:hypothetical protein n=1 Tax=Halomonas sp. TaxID=1486246 RepID=UPI002629AB82|nr:hypothetical protein [Halomonas sp.]